MLGGTDGISQALAGGDAGSGREGAKGAVKHQLTSLIAFYRPRRTVLIRSVSGPIATVSVSIPSGRRTVYLRDASVGPVCRTRSSVFVRGTQMEADFWLAVLTIVVALAFYIQSGRLLAMVWTGRWRDD